MFSKNDVVKAEIVDIGQKGEGIGKSDGFTFFIEGALPGEEVSIKVLKVKKNYGYGKILKVTKPSTVRTEAKCSAFGKCGGCDIMHMNYEAQLFYKEKKIKDSLERIGGFSDISEKIEPIIGMDNPYYYRNKVQIPVRSEKGEIKSGFYAKNSHRIVGMDHCVIQPKQSKAIMDTILEFMTENKIPAYNEEHHRGLIRHVLIKYGFTTGQVMVCIIVNGRNDLKLRNENELVKQLSVIEGVSSIHINYNSDRTNVILGEETRNIYGKAYIEDYIGDIKFQISPLSFYQVNPVQVKNLYDKVIEFGNFNGEETVVDAYCGIGSISLYAAKYVKQVTGIEIVEQAVKDAQLNAELNQIHNAEFIFGEAENIMPVLENEKGIKADIVIVDPPRKGCEEKMLQAILESGPAKIIYVSCNPDTLARDLKILCEEKYLVEKVQPVDMFPHSMHVESVCLLQKR